MLAHKGIAAKRVEIAPGSQQLILRLHGFRGGTVPALKIDGKRVQGTLAISRELDRVKPEPPLFPADPELRTAVEEAERWGEATYQPAPRRIFRWSVANDQRTRTALAKIVGVPAPAITARAFIPLAQIYVRFEGGGEAAAHADVAAVPSLIDHVDALIAEGIIGGDELNAADFQIAPTTRVLLNFRQLRPFVEGRPAAEHARRVVAGFDKEMPAEIPAGWLPAPAGS